VSLASIFQVRDARVPLFKVIFACFACFALWVLDSCCLSYENTLSVLLM